MIKFILKVIKRIVIFFFLSTILMVIVYRFVPIPFTPLMASRLIEQYKNDKDFKCNKDWKPLEKISKNLQKAVISSEDQNFMTHNGFDFEAIEKAYKYNQKKSSNKPARGASTISQQTAKNVFLWQGRTYVRKALEVYFTALIELFWSKERILEVYLNVIEMGDGIYGAEAASQEYFNVSAINLTKQQAASIAAILPNPRKWKASKPHGKTKYKVVKILQRMNLEVLPSTENK
jgi:monofunctional biosynthetic peptidoglycan transglycosylase